MTGFQENPYFSKARQKGRIVVDEPPKLDLDAYISNYKGRTRFDRLYLIGTSSTHFYVDALKAAIAEAKRGNDVGRYEKAILTLAEAAPNDPDSIPDTAWVERVKKMVKLETDRMELELKGYKNNLIKESIRMGYQDLGKHYQSIGDLPSSIKSFNKMHDFMTSNAHLVTMIMHNIQVSVDQRNWYNVMMNTSRIWSHGQTKYEEAKKQSAKLTAALGIAQLASHNFKAAAEEFISTDPRMAQAKLDDPNDEESYNEVITPNDIAIYGGLSALASFTRWELQTKILENKTFRAYLELEPHIRRAVSFFIASKYSACLSILESWKPDYLLDIYLQPCLEEMYFRIRGKAIQQFFIPFSCVTLSGLAEAFNTNEATIEIELTQMIKDGSIRARVDLVERVLLAIKIDKRAEVHKHVSQMAKDYERTAHLRVLRMAILNAGLAVRPAKDKMGMGMAISGGSQERSISNESAAGDLMGGGKGSRNHVVGF